MRLWSPAGARHKAAADAPRSILVALGDGATSMEVLERGVAMAERAQCRLTVMHVLCPRAAPTAGGYVAALPACSDEFGRNLLDAAVDRVSDRVPVHTVLRRGRVLDEIVRRVEAAEHDVVVVGCRRRALARLLSSADLCVHTLARSGARVVEVG